METTKNETWEERRERENADHKAKQLAFCGKIEKAFELCGLEVYGIEDTNEWRSASLPNTSRNAHLSASYDRYGYKGRIRVAMYFTGQLSHRDVMGYDSKFQEISVSGEKTAEQIAADIKRRILPQLSEAITKADEVIAKRNAYENKTRTNWELLAGKKQGERDRGNIYLSFKDGYGTASVNGDSIRLELSGLNIQTAQAIIALLPKGDN